MSATPALPPCPIEQTLRASWLIAQGQKIPSTALAPVMNLRASGGRLGMLTGMALAIARSTTPARHPAARWDVISDLLSSVMALDPQSPAAQTGPVKEPMQARGADWPNAVRHWIDKETRR